jgi:hypothetical protein
MKRLIARNFADILRLLLNCYYSDGVSEVGEMSVVSDVKCQHAAFTNNDPHPPPIEFSDIAVVCM